MLDMTALYSGPDISDFIVNIIAQVVINSLFPGRILP
jgi:hypothetical protein